MQFFFYIKILTSEQRNMICEIALKYHKIWIIRNDKNDYRNSQHFVFVCLLVVELFFLQSSYDHIQGSASYSFLQVHLELIYRSTI